MLRISKSNLAELEKATISSVAVLLLGRFQSRIGNLLRSCIVYRRLVAKVKLLLHSNIIYERLVDRRNKQ